MTNSPATISREPASERGARRAAVGGGLRDAGLCLHRRRLFRHHHVVCDDLCGVRHRPQHLHGLRRTGVVRPQRLRRTVGLRLGRSSPPTITGTRSRPLPSGLALALAGGAGGRLADAAAEGPLPRDGDARDRADRLRDRDPVAVGDPRLHGHLRHRAARHRAATRSCPTAASCSRCSAIVVLARASPPRGCAPRASAARWSRSPAARMPPARSASTSLATSSRPSWSRPPTRRWPARCSCMSSSSSAPRCSGCTWSCCAFTMLYVGGIGTIGGPLLGAVIVSLLPEMFRGLKDYQDLFYGAGLILLLIYAPKGLAAPRQPGVARGQGMTLLSLQGVTRRFGGLVAVDAVDLEVAEGGVTAVIGPNGAGKTTLFNLISGFQTPNAGRIVFDGEDITGAAAGGDRSGGPGSHLPARAAVPESLGAGERQGRLSSPHQGRALVGADAQPRTRAGRARGRGAGPRAARLRRAGWRRRCGGERARLRPAAASRDCARARCGAQASAARRAGGRAFRGRTKRLVGCDPRHRRARHDRAA